MKEAVLRHKSTGRLASPHVVNGADRPSYYGTMNAHFGRAYFTTKYRSTIYVQGLLRLSPVSTTLPGTFNRYSGSATPYIDGYLYKDRNIRSCRDSTTDTSTDFNFTWVHTIEPGYHYLSMIPDQNNLSSSIAVQTDYDLRVQYVIHIGENTGASNLGTATADSFITTGTYDNYQYTKLIGDNQMSSNNRYELWL
jgi:hypothetical protein